ncbi:MAG: hypothetical protein IJH92_03090 [Mogibacterium sp.]|nr:hypothetical protein [Mogibacterium sp.]
MIEAKPKGDSKKKELKLFPIRRKKKSFDMRVSKLPKGDKEVTLLSPHIISHNKEEKHV